MGGPRHLNAGDSQAISWARVPGRTRDDGVTFHTLRHTFASWLVRRGVRLYSVAQPPANSLEMVETTDAHPAPDEKRGAARRLAGAVQIPEASPTLAAGCRAGRMSLRSVVKRTDE